MDHLFPSLSARLRGHARPLIALTNYSSSLLRGGVILFLNVADRINGLLRQATKQKHILTMNFQNLQGQLVQASIQGQTSSSMTVDLSMLSSGMYIVQGLQGGQSKSFKVFKP